MIPLISTGQKLSRFTADTDLIILKDQRGHILNPMVRIDPDGRGGGVTKMGLDATAPVPRTSRFERVSFKEVDLKKYKIKNELPRALKAW